MSNTVTLAILRTAAKQRADMENNNFITDAEWLTYINASYGEFYDLLIQHFEGDYVYSTSAISIVSGTATYALPSDFYKVLGVEILDGSYYVPLKRYQLHHRDSRPGSSGIHLQYRLQGSNIAFIETPTTTETGRLIYVPLYTDLASDGDTFEFHGPGWEEYVIIDAAIKAREKEESSTTSLERKKDRMYLRIEQAAMNREAGEPEEAVDVERNINGIYYDSDYTYI